MSLTHTTMFQFATCTVFPDFCEESHQAEYAPLKVYFILDMVVTVFLPLCIIVFCYIRICSKIFDLKKIRTISRHFSQRQIFKRSSKADRTDELGGKQSIRKLQSNSSTDVNMSRAGDTISTIPETPVEGSISIYKTSEGSTFAKTSDDPLMPYMMSDQPVRPFRLSLGHAGRDKSFDLTTSDQEPISTNPNRVNFNRAQSQVQFKLETKLEEEEISECTPTGTCSQPLSTVTCGVAGLPVSADPPVFMVDPTLQRKRFNFFTIDTKLEECPEVPCSRARSGIISSSIGVIEKHYNAIESARDELAKKMRVYKYQIRVARTAVSSDVVC
eukprot:sb/3466678/